MPGKWPSRHLVLPYPIFYLLKVLEGFFCGLSGDRKIWNTSSSVCDYVKQLRPFLSLLYSEQGEADISPNDCCTRKVAIKTFCCALPHFLFLRVEWSVLQFEWRLKNMEYLNLYVRLCQTAVALSLLDSEQGEADISPNDHCTRKVAIETFCCALPHFLYL